MDVSRLRLLMVIIAITMIGGGVALAAAVDPEPAPPIAATSPSASPPALTATTPVPAGNPTSTPTPTTPVLLPDVRSLPASELSVETTPEGLRLRFSATLANDGPGPLELVPDESQPCPEGQRYALQRLYVDAGGDARFDRSADAATETSPAGCMVDHPDHGHWHFDSMARYALTPLGSTTPAAENIKVSFCLRDNVIVPGDEAGQPQHYGECDGRLAVQGISPGWADVYTAELADQHLDLPDGLAAGTYCLHTEADPLRLLAEVDPTNNAAVLAVQLDGTSVAVAPTNQCQPLPPLD